MRFRGFSRPAPCQNQARAQRPQGPVTRAHGPASTAIAPVLVHFAAGLPNPIDLPPEALREVAVADAPLEEVRDVVRLFPWLLPGLALNAAFLRAALDG